ncbi:carbohydrate kinase family protein [Candidatus Woesearchaeota archaeon]|nr:carbohydrate kinase family protein [Candidatus Woesearchaeota archaeon]
MKIFDVICVGSVTLDHVLTTSQKFSQTKEGDKVLLSNKSLYTGGAATNSAMALVKLGLNVGVVSKVGNDHDGEFVLQELTAHKIAFLTKNKSLHATSSSYIVVSDADHDRVIYTYKGASNDLQVKDFALTTLNPKWFYLGTLMEKSFVTAKVIARYAHKNKIKLLYNPSTYLAQKGISYSRDILNVTNLLILNKEEAKLLLKTKSNDAYTLLTHLHKYGPKSIIITDGAREVAAYCEGAFLKIMPPKVKVVNTTGAGDAFAATVVGMVVRGHAFGEALHAAVLNSTAVVSAHGPKEGLLGYKELLEKIS